MIRRLLLGAALSAATAVGAQEADVRVFAAGSLRAPMRPPEARQRNEAASVPV